MRSDRDIKAALGKLPKGLDETYIRILANIKTKYSDRVDEVKQVLQWLLAGSSLVSLSHLAEAISLQPADTCFEIDGVATNPEDVVGILGSLITINSRRNVSYARFAHYSVEEFLVSERIRESNVANFYIDIKMAHAEVAKTCLHYLSFTDFKDPCVLRSDDDTNNPFVERAQRYQLYSYAANNWFYHLEQSEVDEDGFRTMIRPHLDWFLYPSSRNQQYYSWEQFLSNLPRGITPQTNLPQYYYAILWGLDRILDIVLPKEVNINKSMRFSRGLTLLHFAAMQGHKNIIKRLLVAGADINAQTSGRKTNALRLAAENSYGDVVEMLLKAGADPNMRSASGSTAFYGAARAGCTRCMELLRNAGCDINVRTWDNFTPLMEAVENGHKEAVELLVQWGATLDIKNVDGITPLAAASILGRTDILKVLTGAIRKDVQIQIRAAVTT